MRDKEFDLEELVLNATRCKQYKVAMIISRVLLACDDRFSPEEIADKIIELVNRKELMGFGDLSNWRRSEVCLA